MWVCSQHLVSMGSVFHDNLYNRVLLDFLKWKCHISILVQFLSSNYELCWDLWTSLNAREPGQYFYGLSCLAFPLFLHPATVNVVLAILIGWFKFFLKQQYTLVGVIFSFCLIFKTPGIVINRNILIAQTSFGHAQTNMASSGLRENVILAKHTS